MRPYQLKMLLELTVDTVEKKKLRRRRDVESKRLRCRGSVPRFDRSCSSSKELRQSHDLTTGSPGIEH
jgi:hypothetical protein